MSTVSRAKYFALYGELDLEIERAAKAFGAKHGLTYNPGALIRQTDWFEGSMEPILGFGFDIWPEGTDEGGNQIEVAPSKGPSPAPRLAARSMKPLLALAAAIILMLTLSPMDRLPGLAMETLRGLA